MGKDKFIPEEHNKARSFFRVIGPISLIIGISCMIIAFVDFFKGMQGFGGPSLFWLFFVGMPLIFVGFSLSGMGYGSAIAKYEAREYAPVAKDTFNYLAKETASGVNEISKAIQQGSAPTPMLTCPNCQHQNDFDAKFCDECGEKLVQVCPSCNEVNANDARFCDQCGTFLK